MQRTIMMSAFNKLSTKKLPFGSLLLPLSHISNQVQYFSQVADQTQQTSSQKLNQMYIQGGTVLHPSNPTVVPRATLKQKIEDPQKYIESMQLRQKQEAALHKQRVFNMKSNDLNPRNHLKLQVIRVPENEVNQGDQSESTQLALLKKSVPQAPIPFILKVTKKLENPFVSGRIGRIKGSPKKISPVLKIIQKKHLYTAMYDISKSHKRAAFSCMDVLKLVADHAKNRGYDLNRMWVRDAVVNRTFRIKSIRYHAKSRMGRQRQDWSTITIRLEEKPVDEFFRMMVSGECPPGVAQQWRDHLTENNADLERVRTLQHILTSKGRQQRREMIKRKSFFILNKLKAKGIVANFESIREKVIEDESSKYQSDYYQLDNKSREEKIQERTAIYQANKKLYI